MFTNKFKKYLKNLLILTIITVVIVALYKHYALEQYVSDWIYFFPPFFFIISLAGRLFLEYLVYKNSSWFNYSILGIRGAKFIIYIIVILLYSFNNRDDAVNFILTFFIFYLIYTYFDVKNMYGFMLKNT